MIRKEGCRARGRLNVRLTVGHVALAVVGLAGLLGERVSQRAGNLESHISAGKRPSGSMIGGEAHAAVVMREGRRGMLARRSAVGNGRTQRRRHAHGHVDGALGIPRKGIHVRVVEPDNRVSPKGRR